tara:strand:- start:32311 stop:32541 length:231 start_codon:yes stop_codon:yes gene_type:complete
MFEEDDIEPTPEFKKKTDEAESKLASAMDKPKKPKIGPGTKDPKATVTVGKIYTLKGAAKEAIANDKKDKEEEESD